MPYFSLYGRLLRRPEEPQQDAQHASMAQKMLARAAKAKASQVVARKELFVFPVTPYALAVTDTA